MPSFVSVEFPRRTPDGCFGDDRILLHTNARFQTVDSSGNRKKEKSPPIVWMSYIIDRGVRQKKKIWTADFLKTRQPRKPESTFFQQERERSNHSYPSWGGMRTVQPETCIRHRRQHTGPLCDLRQGCPFRLGGPAARMSTRGRVRSLLAPIIRTAFNQLTGSLTVVHHHPQTARFLPKQANSICIALY